MVASAAAARMSESDANVAKAANAPCGHADAVASRTRVCRCMYAELIPTEIDADDAPSTRRNRTSMRRSGA